VGDEGESRDEELGKEKDGVVDESETENPYGEEENAMIEIPMAGLVGSYSLRSNNSSNHSFVTEDQPTRRVPGLCTICLCSYEVGSDIVWSSNAACEHVFHEQCIEKWLMRQREGPLCPCCRRDFVVDPYDAYEEDEGERDAIVLTWGGSVEPVQQQGSAAENNNNV
jgi:hypothetical protein